MYFLYENSTHLVTNNLKTIDFTKHVYGILVIRIHSFICLIICPSEKSKNVHRCNMTFAACGTPYNKPKR